MSMRIIYPVIAGVAMGCGGQPQDAQSPETQSIGPVAPAVDYTLLSNHTIWKYMSSDNRALFRDHHVLEINERLATQEEFDLVLNFLRDEVNRNPEMGFLPEHLKIKHPQVHIATVGTLIDRQVDEAKIEELIDDVREFLGVDLEIPVVLLTSMDRMRNGVVMYIARDLYKIVQTEHIPVGDTGLRFNPLTITDKLGGQVSVQQEDGIFKPPKIYIVDGNDVWEAGGYNFFAPVEYIHFVFSDLGKRLNAEAGAHGREQWAIKSRINQEEEAVTHTIGMLWAEHFLLRHPELSVNVQEIVNDHAHPRYELFQGFYDRHRPRQYGSDEEHAVNLRNTARELKERHLEQTLFQH